MVCLLISIIRLRYLQNLVRSQNQSRLQHQPPKWDGDKINS
ncbi:unnamed protein product [Larinioides sclopetarius]|uniref:ATP synthase F0 subunit 8 n=1 Tax=Larinioides sclopetarius TaxID=280406 RepID=A0AAV1ZJM6_9ARAC